MAINDIKKNRTTLHDTPSEVALDEANEMSFPASDPISATNITRIEKAPEMVEAATDHQNKNAIDDTVYTEDLRGIKVAILVMDGFEEAELIEPKKALEAVGANVEVVSNKKGQVQGFKHTSQGAKIVVDRLITEIVAEDYDAVLLPGGVVNSDTLRMSVAARNFVQKVDQQAKPIAFICHAGWLLISAGIIKGRKITSWPSLQDDFVNAGGKWVDRETVCDKNFISARKPEDIPAFNKILISLLHERRSQ